MPAPVRFAPTAAGKAAEGASNGTGSGEPDRTNNTPDEGSANTALYYYRRGHYKRAWPEHRLGKRARGARCTMPGPQKRPEWEPQYCTVHLTVLYCQTSNMRACLAFKRSAGCDGEHWEV